VVNFVLKLVILLVIRILNTFFLSISINMTPKNDQNS